LVGRGRPRSNIEKKVVGVYVPVTLADEVMKIKDFREQTEKFWQSLVDSAGESKEKTIQTTLKEIYDEFGELPFRQYFSEEQQLSSEAFFMQKISERLSIPVSPSDISVAMYSHFRGIASAATLS